VKNERTGGVDTFTPGIAIRLSPLFSLGIAANVWMGHSDRESIYKSEPEDPFATEYNFSGFNMVYGILADLSSLNNPIPLKIGATVRSPFKLDADSEVTSEKEPNTVYAITSGIKMPPMIGLGASYRLGENLTFAADIEARGFSESKEIVDFNGAKLRFRLGEHREDLIQFRVGAEYLFISDMGVFPIRIGYKNVPLLYANKDENGDPTDPVVTTGFSIGSGLITGRFALDFSLMMSGYERQQRQYWNVLVKSNIFTLSGIFYF